ncbi:MAG: TrkH family potassium uptake protein [Terriglobia bacterium]
MLVRPRLADFRIIGFYTGTVVIGVGLLMTVPLVVALAFGEWNPFLDFLIGMSCCFSFGFGLHILCRSHRPVDWNHGLVITAVSWICAVFVGAVPHYLSGHFGSFLDSVFDLMSGFTTTGLTLLQDLDHVSYALNTWRHFLTFAGGQGIIVVALTFLIKGTAGIFKMYMAEGKEEQLLPNVIQTARAIMLVALSYMVIGTLVLTAIALGEGMEPVRAFLHGFWVFLAAFSTAGFAPQSANIGYYRSTPFELATMILFIIGSFNFALHWAVWTGKRREIYRNIEIVSFVITLTLTFVIVALGLVKAGIYPDAAMMFLKGFYQLGSAHSGTGFSTVNSGEFVSQWGELAMLGLIVAMAIGGSAASTAGGFKGLRMGILVKALSQDIRRLISPESSVIIQKFHHIKDTVLEERHVRSAGLIVLSYVGIYLLGGVVGGFYGYPLTQAMFDSVSAGSNTGLSAGVTGPGMPTGLKVLYIFEMWAGRLEFIAIGTFAGFLLASVRGK